MNINIFKRLHEGKITAKEWIEFLIQMRAIEKIIVHKNNRIIMTTDKIEKCCLYCEHICFSIHRNDYVICGLKVEKTHVYNICNDYRFRNQRWWEHIPKQSVDKYYDYKRRVLVHVHDLEYMKEINN